MQSEETFREDLLKSVEDLRARLDEAEQTLEAIRGGRVDALVVSGSDGEQVFTLQGADRPYRLMVESINEGAATLSEDGIIMYANARLASLLGTPLDTLLGSPFLAYVADGEGRHFGALLNQGAQDRSRGEAFLGRADRTRIPVLLSFSSLKPSGLEGACLIVTDLTEQKHGEQALMESRSRFEQLFDFSPDATITVDAYGVIRRINRMAKERFGHEREELVGRPIDVLLPERYRRLFGEMRAAALSDPLGNLVGFAAEIEMLSKDGREFPVEVTLSASRQSNEADVICVMRDMSRRKQAETELGEVRRRLLDRAEAERLMLAQELHDGPMQSIYGIMYLLSDTRSRTEMREVREDVDDCMGRLEQVIQSLRTMTGELRPPVLAPYGLEQAITAHAEEFLPMQPELSIHLDLMPDGQLLPEQVRLALYRIYQTAMTNVLRHAQATKIEVRFRIHGDSVELAILDNGRGFEVPESWFEFARHGHLGLAGAAERAQAIGGRLEIRSEPGEGTEVIVLCPVQNSKAILAQASP